MESYFSEGGISGSSLTVKRFGICRRVQWACFLQSKRLTMDGRLYENLQAPTRERGGNMAPTSRTIREQGEDPQADQVPPLRPVRAMGEEGEGMSIGMILFGLSLAGMCGAGCFHLYILLESTEDDQ